MYHSVNIVAILDYTQHVTHPVGSQIHTSAILHPVVFTGFTTAIFGVVSVATSLLV